MFSKVSVSRVFSVLLVVLLLSGSASAQKPMEMPYVMPGTAAWGIIA